MTGSSASTFTPEDGILRVRWHSESKRTRWAMALGCAAAAIWIGCIAHSGALWAACFAFACATFGVLTEQETHIDVPTGAINREVRLFGLVIWSSSLRLADFVAVDSVRIRGGGQANPRDQVFVGLRKPTGTLVRLRYVSVLRGQPSAAAEDFAQGLAGASGLELRSEGRAASEG